MSGLAARDDSHADGCFGYRWEARETIVEADVSGAAHERSLLAGPINRVQQDNARNKPTFDNNLESWV